VAHLSQDRDLPPRRWWQDGRFRRPAPL